VSRRNPIRFPFTYGGMSAGRGCLSATHRGDTAYVKSPGLPPESPCRSSCGQDGMNLVMNAFAVKSSDRAGPQNSVARSRSGDDVNARELAAELVGDNAQD